MARATTAEVREHLDLFGWAKLEAREADQAIAQRERDIATALARGEAPRS